MSDKISSGTKNPNKQTKILTFGLKKLKLSVHMLSVDEKMTCDFGLQLWFDDIYIDLQITR